MKRIAEVHAKRLSVNLILLLMLSLAISRVNSQETDVLGQKPRTLAGAIGKQVGQLGNSILEYKRLKIEREGNIARLKNELERCGNCSQRSDIQAELNHWLDIDRRVKAVEGAALEGMGLGHLRDFNDLGEWLKEGLRNPEGYKQRAQIFDLETIVRQNCFSKYGWTKKADELSANEREAMYKDQKRLREFQKKWDQLQEQCRNEHINRNEPIAIIAHREASMNLCFDENDYTVVKDPRGFNAMRESYKSCMDVNDVLTHLCIENNEMRWESIVTGAKKEGRTLRKTSRPTDQDYKCYAFPDQRQIAVFRSHRHEQAPSSPTVGRPSADNAKRKVLK